MDKDVLKLNFFLFSYDVRLRDTMLNDDFTCTIPRLVYSAILHHKLAVSTGCPEVAKIATLYEEALFLYRKAKIGEITTVANLEVAALEAGQLAEAIDSAISVDETISAWQAALLHRNAEEFRRYAHQAKFVAFRWSSVGKNGGTTLIM